MPDPTRPNPGRLPVVGMVPQLKTLADQIREADPSIAQYDDATLEAAWREQYGTQTPGELEVRQTGAPAQPSPEPTSGVDRLLAGLQNPENMPVLKGIGGGIVGGLLGGPLGAVAGAGIGGTIGDINKQAANDSVMHAYDPLQSLGSGVTQAAFEAGGQALGYGGRELGGTAYAGGAGMNRAQLRQNFPTALEEGLHGGKFGTPILTASGARRAYERIAPIPGQMRAEAQAAGAKPILPSEVARQGGLPVLKEIATGAAQPRTEARAAGNDLRNFIREHSTVTPPQTQWITVQAPDGSTYQLPQRIPGSVVQNPIPVHSATGGLDIQSLKKGLQDRSMASMKAVNADQFPGLSGRVDRGLAIGAQKTAEQRVMQTTGKDLAGANRRVQGQTGLNQAMNPSFRSPQELIAMGVDPALAQVMTSAPASNMRLWMDAGAMTGGALFGGLPGALMAPIAAHVATSPMTRRVAGAGIYELGRTLPNAARGGRAAFELSDDEQTALQQAIKARR